VEFKQKEMTEGKGIQGENCNRTACQKPKSANYYNTVTRKWYCLQCAREIEKSANRDGMSFYPALQTEPKPVSTVAK